MKKLIITLTLLASFFSTAAIFEKFNFIEASELYSWIKANKPLTIVDIQIAKEFNHHHIPGSIETNAYPVKSQQDRDKLLPALSHYKENQSQVVIVCPRGKGGAKRTYTFLKENGIPDEKLFILAGGMAQWPYKELTQNK